MSTHASDGTQGRVTEAENLRHGLNQMTVRAEELARENQELRNRIVVLEELIVNMKEKR